MKKLAVVHFMALEYYPPVTNILDIFSKQFTLLALSTYNRKNKLDYKNESISLVRTKLIKGKSNPIINLVLYWWFNIASVVRLMAFRPDAILYFESYSAFPVYFYKRFFNKAIPIFIHYHEYSSKEWYKTGMRSVRYYYGLEKHFLWKKVNWISHTNKDRVLLFLSDYPWIEAEKVKVMENFPPRSWGDFKKSIVPTNQSEKIKLVYIGSMSITDTYLKELVNWVCENATQLELDIYSYNFDLETERFMEEMDSAAVKFNKTGIEYPKIPKVLGQYDFGVVMYKGNTANYKYNAPNKYFEYLAIGLQVLYPANNPGIGLYSHPNAWGIDYNDLNIDALNQVKGYKATKSKCFFYAEDATKTLREAITNAT